MSLTKSLKQQTHSLLEEQLVRIGENHPNEFWRSIIWNVAKNVFPKTGFNLYNSELTYGLGLRKEKVHLSGTDDEVAQQIIDFMQAKTAIYSPEEKQQFLLYAENNPEQVKKSTWTRFKLSNENKVSIKDYIKNVYHYAPVNMQTKIYNLVIYGLNTKMITEDMIEYYAGRIIRIDGIKESDGNFSLGVPQP